MIVIHCADIHLDSPLKTSLSERQANERNAEIIHTFVRLTAYAQQNAVQAVIIAGDLFDGERIKRRTVDEVLEAIKQTPEVDYLYLPGNHDNATHAFFGRKLPQNLKFFTKKWTTFDYTDAAISGIEMTEQNANTLYESIPHIEGKANIVVLHGQVGTSSGIDQVNLKLLQDKGIDYLALGHIHSYTMERLDARASYCYSGCLEGRGFDECGEKGFVILEALRGHISSSFVPFSYRKLHRVEVDISGLSENVEILRRMDQTAAGISENDMVEFILSGKVNPQLDIAPAYLRRAIRTKYFFSRVKDQSSLELDLDTLKKDVSLKGVFTMIALTGDDADDEKAAMIRAGLAALAGEEIMI